MARFKNEKGLTLIELLITISVLAVVSAIALPVINNVVSSSNSNALVQTQNDVTDFVAKYNAAGAVGFDGTTFSGYVDADGDNVIDSNELVDTLTLDSKFAVAGGTLAGFNASYTSDAAAPTVSLASASTGTPSTGYTTTLVALPNGQGGDLNGQGSCNFVSGSTLSFYCGLSTNAQTALAGLQPGTSVEISHYDSGTGTTVVTGVYTVSSVSLSGTPSITFNETLTIPGDFRQMRF